MGGGVTGAKVHLNPYIAIAEKRSKKKRESYRHSDKSKKELMELKNIGHRRGVISFCGSKVQVSSFLSLASF